jgi:hypothetical protein
VRRDEKNRGLRRDGGGAQFPELPQAARYDIRHAGNGLLERSERLDPLEELRPPVPELDLAVEDDPDLELGL